MNVHLPSDASFFVFGGFFAIVFALVVVFIIKKGVVFIIKKGEGKVSDLSTLKSNDDGKLSDPSTWMSTNDRKRVLDIMMSKYNDDDDSSPVTVKLPRVDVASLSVAANLPAVHQRKDPSQLSAEPAVAHVASLHGAPPLVGDLAPALKPRRRGGRCKDVLESRLLMAGPTYRELRSYRRAVPAAMTRSRGEAPPTEVSIATHARVIKFGGDAAFFSLP